MSSGVPRRRWPTRALFSLAGCGGIRDCRSRLVLRRIGAIRPLFTRERIPVVIEHFEIDLHMHSLRVVDDPVQGVEIRTIERLIGSGIREGSCTAGCGSSLVHFPSSHGYTRTRRVLMPASLLPLRLPRRAPIAFREAIRGQARTRCCRHERNGFPHQKRTTR